MAFDVIARIVRAGIIHDIDQVALRANPADDVAYVRDDPEARDNDRDDVAWVGTEGRVYGGTLIWEAG